MIEDRFFATVNAVKFGAEDAIPLLLRQRLVPFSRLLDRYIGDVNANQLRRWEKAEESNKGGWMDQWI